MGKLVIVALLCGILGAVYAQTGATVDCDEFDNQDDCSVNSACFWDSPENKCVDYADQFYIPTIEDAPIECSRAESRIVCDEQFVDACKWDVSSAQCVSRECSEFYDQDWCRAYASEGCLYFNFTAEFGSDFYGGVCHDDSSPIPSCSQLSTFAETYCPSERCEFDTDAYICKEIGEVLACSVYPEDACPEDRCESYESYGVCGEPNEDFPCSFFDSDPDGQQGSNDFERELYYLCPEDRCDLYYEERRCVEPNTVLPCNSLQKDTCQAVAHCNFNDRDSAAVSCRDCEDGEFCAGQSDNCPYEGDDFLQPTFEPVTGEPTTATPVDTTTPCEELDQDQCFMNYRRCNVDFGGFDNIDPGSNNTFPEGECVTITCADRNDSPCGPECQADVNCRWDIETAYCLGINEEVPCSMYETESACPSERCTFSATLTDVSGKASCRVKDLNPSIPCADESFQEEEACPVTRCIWTGFLFGGGGSNSFDRPGDGESDYECRNPEPSDFDDYAEGCQSLEWNYEATAEFCYSNTASITCGDYSKYDYACAEQNLLDCRWDPLGDPTATRCRPALPATTPCDAYSWDSYICSQLPQCEIDQDFSSQDSVVDFSLDCIDCTQADGCASNVDPPGDCSEKDENECYQGDYCQYNYEEEQCEHRSCQSFNVYACMQVQEETGRCTWSDVINSCFDGETELACDQYGSNKSPCLRRDECEYDEDARICKTIGDLTPCNLLSGKDTCESRDHCRCVQESIGGTGGLFGDNDGCGCSAMEVSAGAFFTGPNVKGSIQVNSIMSESAISSSYISLTGLSADDTEIVGLHGPCHEDLRNSVERDDVQVVPLHGHGDYVFPLPNQAGDIAYSIFGRASIIGNSLGIKNSAGEISACANVIRTGDLVYQSTYEGEFDNGGIVKIEDADNGETLITLSIPDLVGGDNQWGIVSSCSNTGPTGRNKGYFLWERLGTLESGVHHRVFVDTQLNANNLRGKGLAIYRGSDTNDVLTCATLSANTVQCSAGRFWDGTQCERLSTYCDFGEFILKPGTPFSNIICEDIRDDCPEDRDYYTVQSSSETGDRICYPATVCDLDSEWISRQLAEFQDRECSPLRQCELGTTYESRAPTSSSDRRCSRCSSCPANKWEAAPCTLGDNTECRSFTSCNSTSFELADGTPSSDRVCSPCSTCGEGTHRRAGTRCGYGGADIECDANTDCGIGEDMYSQPSALRDRDCRPCRDGRYKTDAGQGTEECRLLFGDPPAGCCIEWSSCAAGEYEIVPGTTSTDRTCSSCPSGTYRRASAAAGECTSYTPCGIGEEPVIAGTSTSDRTCGPCAAGTVKLVDEDVPCSPASSCPAGQGEVTPATPTTDRLCSDCPLTTYHAAEDDDALCKAHTNCNAGEYMVAPGTASRNTDCRTCPDNSFSPAPNRNAQCTPHTVCRDDQIQLVEGSSTADGVCSCAAGTFDYQGSCQTCDQATFPACSATEYISAGCGAGSVGVNQCTACSDCNQDPRVSAPTGYTMCDGNALNGRRCADLTPCAAGTVETQAPTTNAAGWLNSDRVCGAISSSPASGNQRVEGIVVLLYRREIDNADRFAQGFVDALYSLLTETESGTAVEFSPSVIVFVQSVTGGADASSGRWSYTVTYGVDYPSSDASKLSNVFQSSTGQMYAHHRSKLRRKLVSLANLADVDEVESAMLDDSSSSAISSSTTTSASTSSSSSDSSGVIVGVIGGILAVFGVGYFVQNRRRSQKAKIFRDADEAAAVELKTQYIQPEELQVTSRQASFFSSIPAASTA